MKSNSGKKSQDLVESSLITYFRQGELKKFFLSTKEETKELFFEEALEKMRVEKNTKRLKKPNNFYELLEINKKALKQLLIEDPIVIDRRSGSKNQKNIIKTLKAIRNYDKFTDIETDRIKRLIEVFDDGIVPNKTINEIFTLIKNEMDPMKIYKHINYLVPQNYLMRVNEIKNIEDYSTEVVLSYYVSGADLNEWY